MDDPEEVLGRIEEKFDRLGALIALLTDDDGELLRPAS